MGKIKSSQIVGIDLGTTYTSACYIDEFGMPKVIPNLDGESKTPSVVYVSEKGEVLVGQAALNMAFIEPGRIIKESKRDIGSDKVYFSQGDIRITPAWCQAEVLKHVRQGCIKFFSDSLAASKAVISVPAYFGEKERQSVKHSAEMAGIQVLALIHEPTSAGLAYGFNEKQGDRLTAVMDFGGGTFDVSLIQFAGGRTDVIASSGDKKLGGKDIDNILLDIINERFKAEHGIDVTPDTCPEDYYNIWSEVIRNKHLLSSKQEVKIIARAKGKQVIVDITREQFNQHVQTLMARIKKVTLGMLQDAKVNLGDVQHVLLVGGSSRLPIFQETVKEIFGKDIIVGGRVSPDLAISEGASLKAATIITKSGETLVDERLQSIPCPMIEVSDTMPHSLGVLTQDRLSDAKTCSVILRRNTILPCKVSKMYASVKPDQDKFNITVVQGEDGQSSDDCLVVAERLLTLPPRSPEQPSIEVVMSYDEQGMVNVKVEDKISKKCEDITIDFYAKK